MTEKVNRSERIRKRYIEVSQKGEVMMNDEIAICEYLFNKMNFTTMTEAAKRLGISYNGLKKRIKAKQEMYMVIGGQVFVSAP